MFQKGLIKGDELGGGEGGMIKVRATVHINNVLLSMTNDLLVYN